MMDVKEHEHVSLAANREIKSSAFTAYFGKAENAAELYDALVKTGCESPGDDAGLENSKPEDINFTTLNGVMFMARKNDLAFTVKQKVLVISEHQSTINQNMPLRSAIYYGREMEKLIAPRALYRNRQISLPTPEFYTFYNGTAPYPAEQVLKLSDAYLVTDGEPMLELQVKVININPSANHPISNTCRPLYEYSWFMQRIRDCMDQGLERGQAIKAAMEDCEKEGIMVDFIREHGTEAINMLFTEFNMEDALEVRGEEKFSEGLEQGVKQGIEQGVQAFIDTCMEFSISREDTMTRLLKKFSISQKAANAYLDKYWTD